MVLMRDPKLSKAGAFALSLFPVFGFLQSSQG